MTVFPMDSKAGTNGYSSILKADRMRSTSEAWNLGVFHWTQADILRPDASYSHSDSHNLFVLICN